MARCESCKKVFVGSNCPRCGNVVKNLSRDERSRVRSSASRKLKKHGDKEEVDK